MKTIDKPVFSYEISGSVATDGILTLIEKPNGEYRKSVFDLREQFIRDALIKAGWTPPKQ